MYRLSVRFIVAFKVAVVVIRFYTTDLRFWRPKTVSSSSSSFSSSAFCTFSEALTLLPSDCLSVFFLGETSFSGDLWNLGGVDIDFRCENLLPCYGPCVRYHRWKVSVVPFNPVPMIFSDFSSLKNARVLEVSTNRFPRFSLRQFVEWTAGKSFLSQYSHYDVVRYIRFFDFALRKLGFVLVVLKRSLISNWTKNSYYRWLCCSFRFSVFFAMM